MRKGTAREIFDLDPVKQRSIYPVVRYRGHLITNKQVAILCLLAQGMKNNRIAEVLGVTRRTIEGHLMKIRDLIDKVADHRLGDRRMVVFANEMLEGFEVFLRLQEEIYMDRITRFSNNVELIEDWDDEDDNVIALRDQHGRGFKTQAELVRLKDSYYLRSTAKHKVANDY